MTWLTTAQLAHATNLSPQTIRRLVHAGTVTPLRSSAGPKAHYRFTEAHVDQLRQSLQQMAPTQKKRHRRWDT